MLYNFFDSVLVKSPISQRVCFPPPFSNCSSTQDGRTCKVLNSGRLQPNWKLLGYVEKHCQGQTLQLIWCLSQQQRKNFLKNDTRSSVTWTETPDRLQVSDSSLKHREIPENLQKQSSLVWFIFCTTTTTVPT